MNRYITTSFSFVALAIFASLAHAGLFSTGVLTGDGDSGISAAKTYTHAFDMARNEAIPFSINGVPFSVGGSASGTDANHGGNYTATGLTNAFQNHNPPSNNVTGGIGDAIEDFFFQAAAGVETITLTGLTPGNVYKTVFYTSDGFGGNAQTITFSDTGQMETGVVRNAGRIEYAFNAPVTGEITYTFTPEASGSFHNYAFTNETSTDLAPIAYGPIAGLFNTGVDGAGNTLGDNIPDPHYDITVDPSGLGDATVTDDNFPIPPWIANDADSRWIGPADSGDANGPAGVYTYRTTFDLTGLDPSTAYITGDWAADDGGAGILLNGVSVGAGQLSGGFGGLTSFVLDASILPLGTFFDGINTLEFVLNNGGTPDSPTGLRVDNIQGIAVIQQAVVPEPSTCLLAVLGLLPLGSIGWRRRRRA